MNTLIKEQIQQLTPGQQDAVAAVELGRVQKHERLLKQARKSRRFIFASVIALALAYGAAAISRAPFWSQVSIVGFAMAILIQMLSMNRRIDAILELLDHDHDA